MKPRIAFDLDETLGVPQIHSSRMTGFHIREGAVSLLEMLIPRFTLCLWSVSSRRYVDTALSFGLGQYFGETYSWDELPVEWKDIRLLDLTYLIDDDPYHREMAARWDIAERYVVVPVYGSPRDSRNPMGWVHQVEQTLLRNADSV